MILNIIYFIGGLLIGLGIAYGYVRVMAAITLKSKVLDEMSKEDIVNCVEKILVKNERKEETKND